MRRLALAALVLSACDTFYAELEIPDLCHSLPNQRFTVPDDVRRRYETLPDALKSSFSVERTFDFDVRPQLPEELKAMTTDFELTQVRVSAADEATSFAFVEHASISVASIDGDLEPRTFVASKSADQRDVSWSGEPVDLSPYLAEGTLRYAVEFIGSLPDTDIVADVTVCMKARAHLNYFGQ